MVQKLGIESMICATEPHTSNFSVREKLVSCNEKKSLHWHHMLSTLLTVAHQFQKSPAIDYYAQPVDILLQCHITS